MISRKCCGNVAESYIYNSIVTMALDQTDLQIFFVLYRQAYEKCFKSPLADPLTETESKLFYQQILEHTGLTVGWRSLKNYSFFVLAHDTGKTENPSVATLDTLARYVLAAPYTDELKRKDDEGHHPYWFLYRNKAIDAQPVSKSVIRRHNPMPLFVLAGVIVAVLVGGYYWIKSRKAVVINETFNHVTDRWLDLHGFTLKNRNYQYWKSHNQSHQGLTLFTIEGDNWPDSTHQPAISNLLIHRLPTDCFVSEIHLEHFIPTARWQQAGLLLMEDTMLNSRSIRISLAYNDYFGGYQKPNEVLVQGIYSSGEGGKPEEFAHHVILSPDGASNNRKLFDNLSHTALRIEKQQHKFRFLYSGGEFSNMAFKEITSREFNFEPRYIGIFALKGFNTKSPVIPVHISAFSIKPADCN